MNSIAELPTFVVVCIVSTLYIEFASVPDLYSEWLCWCLLFGGLRAYRYFRPEEAGVAKRDGNDESNKLAFGIAVACVCRTLVDVNWVIVCISIQMRYPRKERWVDVCDSRFSHPRSIYTSNIHLPQVVLPCLSMLKENRIQKRPSLSDISALQLPTSSYHAVHVFHSYPPHHQFLLSVWLVFFCFARWRFIFS